MIGIDGGSWDILNVLMERGKLPFLKKILEKGAFGILNSTSPPVTGPAWVSFATGKVPMKHGIYDFTMFEHQSRRTRIVTTRDIKSVFFYEMLSLYGHRCIIINLPLSYPPRKINGIIVGDWLSPRKYIYPEDKEEYIREYRYVRELDIYEEEEASHLLEMIKMKSSLLRNLFINEIWDFFFILFSETDWICHRYFIDIMEDGAKREEGEKIFMEIDGLLGWILKNMDDKTVLMIMSDHGFRIYRRIFYINRWLMKNGYLHVSEDEPHDYKTAPQIVAERQIEKKRGIKVPEKLRKIIIKHRIIHKIFLSFWKIMRAKFYIEHQSEKKFIDFSKTKAWMPTTESYGLYINSRMRFSDGIVHNSEYQELTEMLIEMLQNIDDDGRKVFEMVSKCHHEKKIESSPDIIFMPSEDFHIEYNLQQSNPIIETKEYPYHSKEGIFMAFGYGVKKCKNLNMNIYDIPTTILHIFDVPVPEDMDGKVIKELFIEDSEIRLRNVKRVSSSHYRMEIEKMRIKDVIKKLR